MFELKKSGIPKENQTTADFTLKKSLNLTFHVQKCLIKPYLSKK